MAIYQNIWTMAKDILAKNPEIHSQYVPANNIGKVELVKVDLSSGNLINILDEFVNLDTEFKRQAFVGVLMEKIMTELPKQKTADNIYTKLLNICLGFYVEDDHVYRNISQQYLSDIDIILLDSIGVEKSAQEHKLKDIADFLFFVSKLKDANKYIPKMFQ